MTPLLAAAVLLFGAPGEGWLLLRPNAAPQRVSQVAGLEPADLAVAPDGRRWAVVVEASDGTALALVEDDKVRRRLDFPGLKVLSPEFSADGQTVAFAARSTSQVPHAVSMNYAQLYRVGFTAGEPKKLTSSHGCHELPRPLVDGRMLFVHATCAGGRAVEFLAGTKEVRPVPDLGEVREAAASSDGARVLVTRLAPSGLEVLEVHPRDGSKRRLGVVQAEGPRQRLQWDFGEKAALFQNRGAVFRLDADGHTTEIARFEGDTR